ncbi:MAG: GYF domain-containing protein [Planctomycetota bacterium]|nr:GYF domain-containing protein [Planctomycetota bacterium]MDA1214363.1 GYF domain-containing protein [Planctomycetota bacterium]
MQPEWVYKDHLTGKTYGPFPFELLQQCAARGKVTPKTQVRKEGEEFWKAAEEVENLNFSTDVPEDDLQKTIEFQCKCGASYRVSAEKAGKKIRCRKCKQSLMIPDEMEAFQKEMQARDKSGEFYDIQTQVVSYWLGLIGFSAVYLFFKFYFGGIPIYIVRRLTVEDFAEIGILVFAIFATYHSVKAYRIFRAAKELSE